MKKVLFLSFLLIVLIGCGNKKYVNLDDPVGENVKNNNGIFKIESDSFLPNGDIPSKYTCEGENVSPQLHWSNAPKGYYNFCINCR